DLRYIAALSNDTPRNSETFLYYFGAFRPQAVGLQESPTEASPTSPLAHAISARSKEQTFRPYSGTPYRVLISCNLWHAYDNRMDIAPGRGVAESAPFRLYGQIHHVL